MNPLESRLNYVFQDRLPEPGTAMEVVPGVFWVRMPLPFALDHINLWLLRDRLDGQEGWTIVDCGITNDAIKANWESVFDTMLDGLPVLRVIVTHCHPDHLGLAHWITLGGARQRWQARLWMSLGEYGMGKIFSAGQLASNAGGEAAADHLVRNGLSDAVVVGEIRARKAYFPTLVPSVPAQFRRMHDGDTIPIGGRDWRVIVGYGHSPEHCALYSDAAGVLISGDMVLPRISTNVSVFDLEPEGNPLAEYLGSLDRYDPLPADTLVLPSHGKPFTGLHERLLQLRDHHRARLQEVVDACATRPCHAADIVPIMFRRPLDSHQITFALGEALAHLHLLWHAGQLERHADGGVFRFGPVRG